MMMAKAPAQRSVWARSWVWKTVAAVVVFIAGLSVGMSTERDAQSTCDSLAPAAVAVVTGD